MNKILKGTIAGTAGIALLLGGAGTFALWSDSKTVTAPAITAGHLNVATVGTGKWTAADGSDINPATYYIVPGATIKFTQTLTVDAVGTGLVGTVGYSGLTAAADSTIDPSYLTTTLNVVYNGVPVSGSSVAFAQGTKTMTVELTVKFKDTVTGKQGMDERLSLNNLTINVAQTSATA